MGTIDPQRIVRMKIAVARLRKRKTLVPGEQLRPGETLRAWIIRMLMQPDPRRTLGWIAKQLGVTPLTLSRWRRQLGIPSKWELRQRKR